MNSRSSTPALKYRSKISAAARPALISMNDMVKPACKVLNTVADPVEILAEKLGTAVREGDGWRITNKAVVRLI